VFLIGDSDDHHFLRLVADDYANARPTLHLGALLFSSPEFSASSPAAQWETAWLLGHRLFLELSKSLNARRPANHGENERLSVYFDEGFFRIESGDLLFFGDFSRLGDEPYFNGHNHCDITSFLIWKGENPIVIDPGTYTYRRSLEYKGVVWRDFLRSSTAHNTTVVDDYSQAESPDDFGYQSWPGAKLLVAQSMDDFFLVAGEHDAYHDLVGRAIRIFAVTGNSVLGVDWFPESSATHVYEKNLLFKQHDVKMKGNMIVLKDGVFIWETCPKGKQQILRGSYDPPGGWYSPSYGTLIKASQFRGKKTIEDTAVLSFLLDLGGEGCPIHSRADMLLTESLSHGCFAIRAASSEGVIVVLLNPAQDRSGSSLHYNGCETDAFIAVYKEREPRKALFFDGSYFRCYGLEPEIQVLKSQDPS
jgi:hypothetical protein